MSQTSVSDLFLIMFLPEKWTSVAKFREFYGNLPRIDEELKKGTLVTEHHLNKYETLAGLANRLAPLLKEDLSELDREGYSSAQRSREYAALIETLINELYATLDGVRRTLYAAYRKVQGVQNSSTEKLFSRAANNEYGAGFPEEIRILLEKAFNSWFPKLRSIRTEVTHGLIGNCYLNPETNTIGYMHQRLGTMNRAFIIEDVTTELNNLAKLVSELAEEVYKTLLITIELAEVQVTCGIYKGRFYQRIVAPETSLSFNSGRCFSWEWFIYEPGFECPMRESCGAYQRVVNS